jgi:hypothetical protein
MADRELVFSVVRHQTAFAERHSRDELTITGRLRTNIENGKKVVVLTVIVTDPDKHPRTAISARRRLGKAKRRRENYESDHVSHFRFSKRGEAISQRRLT